MVWGRNILDTPKLCIKKHKIPFGKTEMSFSSIWCAIYDIIDKEYKISHDHIYAMTASKRISKRGSVLKVRGGCCYNYRFKLYK